MKKKIIIGNWKMNPRTLKEAEKLFAGIAGAVRRIKKTEVVICPPYLFLANLKNLSRKIVLGAQDAFWEEVGAFTGEVSGEMLYNLGVRYVILGHSERRELGETDGFVNKKMKSVRGAGLVPILCVGEKERDANHEYFGAVKSQVERCLKGVSKNLISKIHLALGAGLGSFHHRSPPRRDPGRLAGDGGGDTNHLGGLCKRSRRKGFS